MPLQSTFQLLLNNVKVMWEPAITERGIEWSLRAFASKRSAFIFASTWSNLYCEQQAASSKQQAASSKQQAASNKQQAASSKQFVIFSLAVSLSLFLSILKGNFASRQVVWLRTSAKQDNSNSNIPYVFIYLDYFLPLRVYWPFKKNS